MIITSNELKAEFSNGNQATEESFGNLIDSMYIKSEDSLLLGPLGLTGNYGLLGPSGGTHIGLYLSGSTAPTGYTASGSTGQVIISITGGTGYVYLHNGNQWLKIEASASF